jgi:hypothetical protein
VNRPIVRDPDRREGAHGFTVFFSTVKDFFRDLRLGRLEMLVLAQEPLRLLDALDALLSQMGLTAGLVNGVGEGLSVSLASLAVQVRGAILIGRSSTWFVGCQLALLVHAVPE